MPRALLPCALLALSLLPACDGAEKERAKAAAMQKDAEARIAKIEADAKAKLDDAQKKIDELEKQIAETGDKAKAEVDEEVGKAKADAERFEKEAAEALGKARAAYKESANFRLADAAKDLAEGRAKAQKAPAKVKADFDRAYKDIVAKETALQKDIAAFDKATLDTLKQTKAKVDQELFVIKQLVKAARAKLPAT
jgi:chromosome segregation ATPase